jgi:DNA polymerase-4
MSSQKAKKLCPDAIFVRGDMNEYIKYSKLIRQIIHDKAPLYQQASIDEFYLDISGMDRFFGIVKWTTELRETIIKESGLPISCGLSVNKIVSKIATGLSKPNGFLYVPAGTEKEFLAPLPIEKIPMVGKKTTELLHNAGIFDIGTLSNTPVLTIEKLLGKHGAGLWMRANGIDHTPIEPYSERKSISTETTFREDSKDLEMMRTTLLKMIEDVCFTLRQKKFMTGCLTVKIKYANFEKETKQCTFSYTSSDAVLMEKITALFDSLYNKQKYVRLIGVRLSNLVHGNYQASLFETPEKTHNLYTALDKIRVKYGQDAVKRALGKSNRHK